MINLKEDSVMSAAQDEGAPKPQHGATWKHLIVNSK